MTLDGCSTSNSTAILDALSLKNNMDTAPSASNTTTEQQQAQTLLSSMNELLRHSWSLSLSRNSASGNRTGKSQRISQALKDLMEGARSGPLNSATYRPVICLVRCTCLPSHKLTPHGNVTTVPRVTAVTH